MPRTDNPLYAQVARLLTEGLDDAAVSARLGMSMGAVSKARHRARSAGLLPPRPTPPPQPYKPPRRAPPLRAYHHMRYKGEMPPLGSLGAVYEALSPTLRARLRAAITPEDGTLADTVTRLLERALHDTNSIR